MIVSRFKNFLNNMQIRNKLISISLISGIIPMLGLSIFLIGSMRSQQMSLVIQVAEENSMRITNDLIETVEICVNISDWLYIDESLLNIAKKDYRNQRDLIEDYNNYTRFDELLLAYDEIESIRFYMDNPSLISNSYLNRLSEKDRKSSWYLQATLNQGKIEFIQRYDEIARRDYFALVRGVYSVYGDLMGVLVINVSDKLSQSLQNQTMVSLIAAETGIIQFASQDEFVGKNLFGINGISPAAIDEVRAIIYVPFLRERAMVNKSIITPEKSKTRLFVVNMIPVSEILSETNQTLLASLLLIFISLFFSLSLSLAFSFGFSRRIQLFRKEMHQVAQSHFELSDKIEGNDEIGKLYVDLKIMVASLQKLIHEVYEQKLIQEQLNRHQREVEFKMLTSQINPHFLYNTLETIRMKNLLNGQREIANIVKKVSHIMRRNLGVKNSLVLLEEELDCVRDYLEIQSFRYGDRFEFVYDIGCSIEDYYILPLLIQPIVENAFIHGLEDKETKGHLKLEVLREEGFLLIKISDDGVGISETKLKAMKAELGNLTKGILGIGLSNVHKRIQLFYGEGSALEIESEEGKGTVMVLRLPDDVSKGMIDV